MGCSGPRGTRSVSRGAPHTNTSGRKTVDALDCCGMHRYLNHTESSAAALCTFIPPSPFGQKVSRFGLAAETLAVRLLSLVVARLDQDGQSLPSFASFVVPLRLSAFLRCVLRVDTAHSSLL